MTVPPSDERINRLFVYEVLAMDKVRRRYGDFGGLASAAAMASAGSRKATPGGTGKARRRGERGKEPKGGPEAKREFRISWF